MELLRNDLPFKSQEGLVVPLGCLLDTCNELWAEETQTAEGWAGSTLCRQRLGQKREGWDTPAECVLCLS